MIKKHKPGPEPPAEEVAEEIIPETDIRTTKPSVPRQSPKPLSTRPGTSHSTIIKTETRRSMLRRARSASNSSTDSLPTQPPRQPDPEILKMKSWSTKIRSKPNSSITPITIATTRSAVSKMKATWPSPRSPTKFPVTSSSPIPSSPQKERPVSAKPKSPVLNVAIPSDNTEDTRKRSKSSPILLRPTSAQPNSPSTITNRPPWNWSGEWPPNTINDQTVPIPPSPTQSVSSTKQRELKSPTNPKPFFVPLHGPLPDYFTREEREQRQRITWQNVQKRKEEYEREIKDMIANQQRKASITVTPKWKIMYEEIVSPLSTDPNENPLLQKSKRNWKEELDIIKSQLKDPRIGEHPTKESDLLKEYLVALTGYYGTTSTVGHARTLLRLALFYTNKDRFDEALAAANKSRILVTKLLVKNPSLTRVEACLDGLVESILSKKLRVE